MLINFAKWFHQNVFKCNFKRRKRFGRIWSSTIYQRDVTLNRMRKKAEIRLYNKKVEREKLKLDYSKVERENPTD